MRPYDELTPGGQVRRLRPVARAALDAFGFGRAGLTLVHHLENTTFRVDVHRMPKGLKRVAHLHPTRFLLRIHRSGYRTREEIESEMMWLRALERARIPAPAPLAVTRGRFTSLHDAPGLEEPRVCTLLRWVPGIIPGRRRSVGFARDMGELMARLHVHAAGWSRPAGFTRPGHDYAGLFEKGFAGPAWDLLKANERRAFAPVVDAARDVFASIGTGKGAFGLIHADLHPHNVVRGGGHLYPIDFDDCGLGPWAYDVAVTLSYWLHAPNVAEIRDAFLEGYGKHRTLSAREREALPTLVAARDVMIALWVVDRAQGHDRIAAGRDRTLNWILKTPRAWRKGTLLVRPTSD